MTSAVVARRLRVSNSRGLTPADTCSSGSFGLNLTTTSRWTRVQSVAASTHAHTIVSLWILARYAPPPWATRLDATQKTRGVARCMPQPRNHHCIR